MSDRSDSRAGKNPPPQDIVQWTALELSRAIKAKAVSCLEVMEAFLDRIDEINPTYNAIVSLQDREPLMQEARKCDAELDRGDYRGWMHGFPHAVKDLADAKGIRTSFGSPLTKANIPAHDAIHVERIRKAGAIIIGKTNVPEFGLGSHTYNPVFGPTLNPYDGKSTAGGSSGGAAAALALHLLPVADGSDMMGSLRNPAAFNNVVGFRPSLGLVPTKGHFLGQMSCNGPMGRSVADTAMLLSTIAGHDSRAPLSLPEDPKIFAQPLEAEMKGIRIGWLGDFNGHLAMEDGVLDLCQKSLASFEQLGCCVDEASVHYPMEKLWQTWLTLRHWEVLGGLSAIYEHPRLREMLKPELLWEAERGLALSGDQVYQASVARSRWYDALVESFREFDFLIMPSAQVFPFDAETHWPEEIAGRTMDTYHRWMEVASIGTLSGCPIISVPVGFGAKKLPMGIQIIGRMQDDLGVLRLAHAYEQVAAWDQDWPSPG